MFETINNQGIAQGFQTLAGILAPSAEGMINADLARYKRDDMVAGTRQKYADVARLGADEKRLLAEAGRTSGFSSADAELAAILSDPAYDPADPLWRKKVAGAAVRTQDGLKEGPGGVTGMTTFIDPNFVSPEDLSDILVGTGVVDDYAKTPTGFGIGEANDLRENQDSELAETERSIATTGMDNEADVKIAGMGNETDIQIADANNQTARDMDIYKIATRAIDEATGRVTGGRAPLTISPNTQDDFSEMLAEQLGVQFPGAELDPALQNELLTEVLENYQTGRNSDAAIAEVLSGLGTTTEDGWLWDSTNVVRQPQPGQANGAAPAPAGAGVGAGTPPPGVRTFTNPQTGEKLYQDPETGMYRPFGPVRTGG